jgi:hypothetical protein
MGLGRKKFFIFIFIFFFMEERVLIGCFLSHLSWFNNSSCPFLSRGHKGKLLYRSYSR